MEKNIVLNNADSATHTGLSGKNQLNSFLSIFLYLGFAVKLTVLVTLSFIYFIAGAIAVIFYILIYERLLEKIINRVKKEKRKSPYYYKWKNHHLEVNLEG
jgi:hypothetical protein